MFVSYPADKSAPKVIKAFVSGLIRRNLAIWMYDPSPFGFSRAELEKISYQRTGDSWEKQTQEAAKEAGAVGLLHLNAPQDV